MVTAWSVVIIFLVAALYSIFFMISNSCERSLQYWCVFPLCVWMLESWNLLVDRVNDLAFACLTCRFTSYRNTVLYPRMSGFLRFNALAPKTKNLVVAGGLTSFVFGVYFYTMRAVGGTDELQIAIDKFEEHKQRNEAEATLGPEA